MNLWSRLLARIDRALHLRVGIEIQRACGTDRRHTAGQIQLREGPLREHSGGRTGRFELVEQMVVHPHKAWDDRAPLQIERRRAGRNSDSSGIAECGDAAALDDHCLIILARTARAVDDAHVRQRRDRRHRANERNGLAAGQHENPGQEQEGFRHLTAIPAGPPARRRGAS